MDPSPPEAIRRISMTRLSVSLLRRPWSCTTAAAADLRRAIRGRHAGTLAPAERGCRRNVRMLARRGGCSRRRRLGRRRLPPLGAASATRKHCNVRRVVRGRSGRAGACGHCHRRYRCHCCSQGLAGAAYNDSLHLSLQPCVRRKLLSGLYYALSQFRKRCLNKLLWNAHIKSETNFEKQTCDYLHTPQS